MVTFVSGKVDRPNANVTFEGLDHPAFSERDAEGNIKLTHEGLDPVDKMPVKVVLHNENNWTCEGTVKKEGNVFLLHKD